MARSLFAPTTLPRAIEKLGFVQVAPFYYFPAWWEGAANTSHPAARTMSA